MNHNLVKENEMLVKCVVTGKMYDPVVEFAKLMAQPETVEMLVRMKEERGRGWPINTGFDKGDTDAV
jgi:hypothetical protein